MVFKCEFKQKREIFKCFLVRGIFPTRLASSKRQENSVLSLVQKCHVTAVQPPLIKTSPIRYTKTSVLHNNVNAGA